MKRIARTLEWLRTSLWVVPAICLVGAFGLSVLAHYADEHAFETAPSFAFQGGPEGARGLLSAVASSMMTFTGVVFSVTVLVLQLASNQFSPRVLREFLREPASKVTLGVFVGTFVYALLTMRSVRGASDGVEEHVPALSVWLAVVLALSSVATFIYFLNHVAQSIRAVNMIGRIGRQTRERLERLFPEGIAADADAPPEAWRPPGSAPVAVVPHEGVSGVLVEVDEERLWKAVRASDAVVALVPMPGDFVPHGSVLFEIRGDASSLDAKALREAVVFGPERTLDQDVAFGLRQLVDIAERALSPGINDPTTAVQALDQIHDILRRLVRRRIPSALRSDERGRVRLVLPRPEWETYVRLAVDEIRLCAREALPVYRRLHFLIDDLLQVAPPSRQAVLRRQRRLLLRASDRRLADPRDRRFAASADPQGHAAH